MDKRRRKKKKKKKNITSKVRKKHENQHGKLTFKHTSPPSPTPEPGKTYTDNKIVCFRTMKISVT